jgi:tRNA G18 (ribose-2'-O)-methylase SpoU
VKSPPASARGFFAIGIEGVSKAVNLGNLVRSAHAFGAMDTIADTSRASSHLPLYHWQSVDELRLPRGCRLVGIELLDEAIELPAFPHPLQAAYVLGPERGVLSPGVIARCHHLVRIPTAFSLNVATAGAIVMYDRLRSLGRFASRPVAGGSLPEPVTEHVQGGPRRRNRRI